MASNPDSNSNSLKDQLISVHQKLDRTERLLSPLNAILGILIWIIVFVLIESRLYLSVEIKSISIIGIVALVVAIFWIGKKNRISFKFIDFYRDFSSFSNLKELGYALDLEKNTHANPKLVEAAIFKNLELVDPNLFRTKLKEYVDKNLVSSSSKKTVWFVGLTFAVFAFTALNFHDATYRYVSFFQHFEKPNPYTFSVQPGFTILEQGSPFVVSIEFTGEVPDEVALFLKTPIEQEFRKRGMDGQDNMFSSSPIDLNTDITYYLEMDGFKSTEFVAQVQLRPRLVEFVASVIPPAHTSLDTIRYEYPFSQIQGIEGAELILLGTVNKSVSEFKIINTEMETEVTVSENFSFTHSFIITTSDTVRFSMQDESGLANLNPFQFVVDPFLDEYPIAEILEPKSSYEDIEPKEINLLYRTSDDFGITSSSLNYELRRAFVEEPMSEKIPLENPSNGILKTKIWNIEEFNLKPKDELSFWIETTDNDGTNGYKSSRSEILTLTLPSLIDYFEDIGEKEDEVETDLEEISDSFDEMQEQYEMFKEQLREDPEVNYQDLRQLQEVQDRQEQIQDQIEELNQKFDELKEELTESDLLSEETLEAYDELKKLMDEIDDPAFLEALEMMQENLNSMTPEQLREAMENAEFNEQLYQERLERTIELLKQVMLNADLERLAQAYEDLARQEEESDSNQKSEEALLEQTNQVEEQLENLDENASSKTEQAINKLQEQSKRELEEIKKELEQRIQDGESGQSEQNKDSENSGDSEHRDGEQSENQNSQQSGESNPKESQSLQKKYNQLAEMTRNAMAQMNQQQMNINIAGLQYILYSLINLSLEQEELTTYASATESRSQAYVGFARDQKNVENIFGSLSDSLFQLSTEIPQFSNQINQEKLEVERLITESLTQMTERNQNRSSIATRQALGGINKISFLIANLLEQLQNQSNSGSGSGGQMSMQQMMEQMQQMGQSQQQINQQIQDMINDIQGERLSNDQMDRLNQLSRQQNEIRKQLQDMQQNGSLEGGDEMGSELERMIEQMEETINDLRGGAVDPTLIERQQNILSRMLEAEDALQERDEEERREGTVGDEISRPTPPELTLEELEQQIRNRLNDPNFTKYSPDYQRLIERYFELLKEIQNQEIQ